jgi:two-component system chemotaxis response regulator CheY
MKKIVIVEDDVMLGEIYKKKFSQAGFEVEIAVNGVEALEKIRNMMPQLVLLDLVLSDGDGFTVLKNIKQDKLIADTRVYIFSNLAQDENRQKAVLLGAEGFFVKSEFTPQQIVEEVNRVLEINHEAPVFEDTAVSQEQRFSSMIHGTMNELTVGDAQSKIILMVEDEDAIIENYGKKLFDEGFSIDLASNGKWAIEKIQQQRYDAVVVNYLMPEADGLELIRQIRENKLNKSMPIFVLFSSKKQEKIKESKEAGADEVFVIKEVDPEEFAQKIKATVGGGI